MMREKPNEVDPDIVKLAFDIIDEDRDDLITKDDIDQAIKKREDIKLSPSLTEAMFLDCASTKFTQPSNISHSYSSKLLSGLATINLQDVVSAMGFRKNPRDRKWISRRMRNQWIVLVAGLLPKGHRDRLFAPSPSPIFSPPSLTSRERDSLNVSPIGFSSSRPSSRPVSPNDTLSGYFTSTSLSQPGTANGNLIQKPRFVNTAPATLPKGSLAGSEVLSASTGFGNGRMGSKGIKKSQSVKDILMRKRPKSRADGRLSRLGARDNRNNQSVELAMGIVRATTPHSKMTTPVMSSPIRPMTSGSTTLGSSSFGSGDFMGIPFQLPHQTSNFPSPERRGPSNILPPPSSPVFGFDSKSSHSNLGSMIKNTSVLQDQQIRGIKAWQQKRLLASMEKHKPVFNTVCGQATVSSNWRSQQVLNAKQTLQDNKGWSNKMDAFEKRLEAGERETRVWMRGSEMEDFETFQHTNDLQRDKVMACKSMRNFFGKSAQGSFNVDEEKPYRHEYRDWKRLPVFYN